VSKVSDGLGFGFGVVSCLVGCGPWWWGWWAGGVGPLNSSVGRAGGRGAGSQAAARVAWGLTATATVVAWLRRRHAWAWAAVGGAGSACGPLRWWLLDAGGGVVASASCRLPLIYLAPGGSCSCFCACSFAHSPPLFPVSITQFLCASFGKG
jgi:hypothetical protein